MRNLRAERSRRNGRKRFTAVQAQVLAELRDGATVVSIWETHIASLKMSYEQFTRYVRKLRADPVRLGHSSRSSAGTAARAQDAGLGPARVGTSVDRPRAASASAPPMAARLDLPGRETKDLI
jgi:hypothetical protein